jgi:NADPH2:quinone reductase
MHFRAKCTEFEDNGPTFPHLLAIKAPRLTSSSYHSAKEQAMSQTMLKTMNAIAIDHFGGIERMSLQSLPVPEIGPDEILVRVDTAGVGVWDTYEREGMFAKEFKIEPRFPYVLGSEGSGTVVAVGDHVDRFNEGDRVYAISFLNPKGGFYAEYVAVHADFASRIPTKLTDLQAGVMPIDAVTALRGLDDTLGLQRGQSVIVVGASGGIGHLAVQFAQRMGARVLAVASRNDGVALVKRLGVEAVVEGHSEDILTAARGFAPLGLDAALITTGGVAADKALEAVRNGGKAAYPNGVKPEPKTRTGVKVAGYDGMPDKAIIAKIDHLIDSGPFDVHVARSFPLDQAAEAHRALGEHYLGKLALRPG